MNALKHLHYKKAASRGGRKTMQLKKGLTALIAVSALMAGIAQAQDDPIKIGVITTLSGGGSSLGVDTRDGYMLAVEANAGTLDGHEVRRYDDRGGCAALRQSPPDRRPLRPA